MTNPIKNNFSLSFKAYEFCSSHIVRAYSEPHGTEVFLFDGRQIYDYYLVDNKFFQVAVYVEDNSSPPFLVKSSELQWYCNECSNCIPFKINGNKVLPPDSCDDCLASKDD